MLFHHLVLEIHFIANFVNLVTLIWDFFIGRSYSRFFFFFITPHKEEGGVRKYKNFSNAPQYSFKKLLP